MAARAGALLRASTGLAAAGLVVLATPASAAGLFEMLFGAFQHHAPPPEAQAYAGSSTDFLRGSERTRSEAGPASAYCVRMSDGFYFPVQAHAGVSAAAACQALCPANQTKLYSGGGIDHAAAPDGSRYADLDTAFLYRKELVAGATCNGRDHFGLARIDVKTDPTLRPGDIVATQTGLVAVTGMKNRVAEFTPIENDRAIPNGTREKLAGVKIMRTAEPRTVPVTMAASAPARDENRSAQLSR
ncbi:MAG TPA: DUF2865 domain-containing protein [Pseudolabrys sp.]|nr:DUF2865 domain-containing protein [Pseudolabrys sp.]